MLKVLLSNARRIRRKHIKDTAPFLPALRKAYKFTIRLFPIFTRKGLPVNIGGAGYFRVHPSVAIGTYDFETWGGGHNGGFGDWLRECTGKRCVIDVGAHIGMYALPASKVLHPDGVLYAFEPAQIIRDMLTSHIEYNDITNMCVEGVLIGEGEKRQVPFFEDSVGVSGVSSISGNAVSHKKERFSLRETKKEQTSLDDFCLEHDIRPEVIKMDVEGAEYGVLKGAREVLRTAKPTVFLSVHPRHLRELGVTLLDLYTLINDAGYGVFTTNGERVFELEKEEYILRPARSCVS